MVKTAIGQLEQGHWQSFYRSLQDGLEQAFKEVAADISEAFAVK